MKIVTVVGARPQFIKAAALSRVLRPTHQEVLVHTGQHFDDNMSDIFFRELGIPTPDYNLGIAGGSHAEMTGRMLIAIEEVLQKENPDMLLVYGDTNSTLAAALAAVKLHIPVAHVEAGNRFGTLQSPEEVNRILTDHVSTIRFACVQSAIESMAKENLLHNAYLVGDPMYDAFEYYRTRLGTDVLYDIKSLDGEKVEVPGDYYYLTCHRQENTDNPAKLEEILYAMQTLDAPTIYPVHPRNKATVLAIKQQANLNQIIFVEPVGYLTSIALVSNAKKIVTDSGGVQREAFFAGKQCVSVLDFVCWPETMVNNCNQLVKPDRVDILNKLQNSFHFDPDYQPFGDGHACEKIIEILSGNDILKGKGAPQHE